MRFILFIWIFSTFLIPVFSIQKEVNSKKLKNSDYMILNDGSHDFGLETYYIKPVFQVTQLKKMFNNFTTKIESYYQSEKVGSTVKESIEDFKRELKEQDSLSKMIEIEPEKFMQNIRELRNFLEKSLSLKFSSL